MLTVNKSIENGIPNLETILYTCNTQFEERSRITISYSESNLVMILAMIYSLKLFNASQTVFTSRSQLAINTSSLKAVRIDTAT